MDIQWNEKSRVTIQARKMLLHINPTVGLAMNNKNMQ